MECAQACWRVWALSVVWLGTVVAMGWLCRQVSDPARRHQPAEEVVRYGGVSPSLSYRMSVRCRAVQRWPWGLGRVLMSELRVVVPAVVFEFGLQGEPQFALGALVNGHQPIPPTAAKRSSPPHNCIPI